jgi:hypothetical protein
MNLQSKKARVPIAALGVTALIAAAGAFASPAFAAPVPLTLTSGATTPAVGNFGYGSPTTANAAYAMKLTGADENVTLSLESAPTGGSLAYDKVASNGVANTSFTPISTAGVVANEVQTLTFTTITSGGTYTLTFDGQTTAPIAWNGTNVDIQAALVALSNIAPGDVVVTGGTGPATMTATFGGVYTHINVPQMLADGTSLTGLGHAATVTTATDGSGPALNAIGMPVSSDYIYVTGNVPGTYTFRMFQDTNTSGTYEAADERSSPLITLTVYDAVGAATASTSDDVAPVITTTSPINTGIPVVATITYSKAISTSDARGDGATGLNSRLSALTYLDKDAGATAGTVTTTADAVPSYSATTFKTTYAVGTPSHAGTIALRGDFTNGGAPDPVRFGATSVVVNSNNITNLALAPTDVVGSVKTTSPAVAIKP